MRLDHLRTVCLAWVRPSNMDTETNRVISFVATRVLLRPDLTRFPLTEAWDWEIWIRTLPLPRDKFDQVLGL